MLAENVDIGVGPWSDNVREPPIALTLLFLGEFLFRRRRSCGGLIGLFQPEERLFDPGLADKVSRFGFWKRKDTSDNSQLDRTKMGQGVFKGIGYFLSILSRWLRKVLLVLFVACVVVLATVFFVGAIGVAIVSKRSAYDSNDAIRVFRTVDVLHKMGNDLMDSTGIVVELARLLNGTEIEGS